LPVDGLLTCPVESQIDDAVDDPVVGAPVTALVDPPNVACLDVVEFGRPERVGLILRRPKLGL
jgi:hypothetical protein